MSTPVSIRALNWKQLLALLGIIVLLPVAMVLAIPALVGFLALIFILAPIACIVVPFKNHRKRKVAKAFQCLGCGQFLGAKSVRLANREFRKRMKKALRQIRWSRPSRIRMLQTCHAICATCEMRYSYLPEERTFVAEHERRPIPH